MHRPLNIFNKSQNQEVLLPFLQPKDESDSFFVS